MGMCSLEEDSGNGSCMDLLKDTGAVAQLEERLICIQQVIGSNPFGSTMRRAHSSVG